MLVIAIIAILVTAAALARDYFNLTYFKDAIGLLERAKQIEGTGPFKGKCLDVRGPAKDPGTLVQIWSCSDAEEMLWAFDGNGPVIGYGGQCLTLAPEENRDGGVVTMQSCEGDDTQHWIGRDGGYIQHSSGRCLDIQGPNTVDGTRVQVWECQNVAQHQWSLR